MTDETAQPSRIDCVVVAGGQWHDIDFARLEILKLLGDDERIKTRVFADYEFGDALDSATMLVTYTCNVIPSEPMQHRVRKWLADGGRWFALHGTNAVLELLEDGRWSAPRSAPMLAEMLGSQFISHPPIVPYRVTVADPGHPLVADIEPFEADDELYHMALHQPIHVLLQTECTVTADGFEEGGNAPGTHPVFYIKHHGKGGVLYLTLGHCRGHYDLQPLLEWWPSVDRGSWNVPEFRILLGRGLRWAAAASG